MVNWNWNWRKEGLFIKAVIKENLIWIRPLGVSRLRWEHRMKKDVKAVEPNVQEKRSCKR